MKFVKGQRYHYYPNKAQEYTENDNGAINGGPGYIYNGHDKDQEVAGSLVEVISIDKETSWVRCLVIESRANDLIKMKVYIHPKSLGPLKGYRKDYSVRNPINIPK